jgi:hypothetical protein
MLLLTGNVASSRRQASNPPAEAPMPTAQSSAGPSKGGKTPGIGLAISGRGDSLSGISNCLESEGPLRHAKVD